MSEKTRRLTTKRRNVLKLTGGTALATTLAGCQAMLEDEEESIGGRVEGEDIPSDLFEGETFTIGCIAPAPKEGGLQAGIDMRRAAEYAAQQLNESGGVLGADFEVVTRDSGMTPAPAREAYRLLSRRDDADFFTGIAFGQPLLAVVDELVNDQNLFVGSGSGDMRTVQNTADNYERHKYRFRTVANTLDFSEAVLQVLKHYAEPCGWDRAYWTVEGQPLFEHMMGEEYLSRLEEETDIEWVEHEMTSTAITDWTPLLDDAESQDVDLFVTNNMLTGTTLSLQWSKDERPFQLGGINVAAMMPGFWETMNGQAAGAWTLSTGAPDSYQTDVIREFNEGFNNTFGYQTGAWTAYCQYDAVMTLAHAIGQVGSSNPDDLIPYMAEDLAFEGGCQDTLIEFNDPDHDYPHDLHWRGWFESGWCTFVQWQEGGELTGFAPPKVADADSPGEAVEKRFTLPPWLE